MEHSHCVNCFSTYCSKNEFCPVVFCKAGCYARFHECKTDDHTLVCPFQIVDCINADSGCTFRIPRCHMYKHLMSCPGYVVLCCFQWVRKMLQSDNAHHSHYIRKPKDVEHQIDLSHIFYDQRRGHKKLAKYVGKRGTRACQEVEVGKGNFSYSYMYNPAHPTPGILQWYRTSTVKRMGYSRPPFMTPIPSFLQNSAAYKPPPPLHWTRPAHLMLKANKLPSKDKVQIVEQDSSAVQEPELCLFGDEHVQVNECSRIESSFSCYNVIAINNLPLLHRSEASLHLSCGQMLRRNQISKHVDVVHNQIMSGIMDGWMIERCPLAVYGCEFYQVRVQPKGGKYQVKFDQDLSVFYLRSKCELPSPPTNGYIPVLPIEIWCLIGQYCDSYTLTQLCAVSRTHNILSTQLLHSRGLANKRWTRGLGPRCWAKQRKVTQDGMQTVVNISCSFAACKRWESRPKMYLPNNADWGLSTSLTETTLWEIAPRPHISRHLGTCPYNIRNEHKPELAAVYGHPIIDPNVILRNFT